MIRRRFFPLRWARITAWTAATLAWGSTAIAVASQTPPEEAAPVTLPPADSVEAPSAEAVPAMPASGLVVIRFTPAPTPPPQIITRTVTVPSAPVQQQAPATVVSSGS